MAHSPTASRKSSKPSFLRHPTFASLASPNDSVSVDQSSSKSLPKKKLRSSRPSSPTNDNTAQFDGKPNAENKRPKVLRKGSSRPSSIFGSLRSFRVQDDDAAIKTAAAAVVAPQLVRKGTSTSSGGVSMMDKNADIGRSRNLLQHGEVQTNSSLFWKKKEYLVLTETHLIRFKNQGKASESFPSIPPLSRSGSMRSIPSPLIGSTQDSHSDNSGDTAAGIPLEQIVAVYQPDDTRQSISLDVSYLDNESGQGSTIAMQFVDIEERDSWSIAIRTAANKARLLDIDPIQIRQAEYAARVVEREQDYDVSNFTIYKLALRSTSRSSGRSSTDDSSKAAANVGFLVIGLHKVHLIPLPKNSGRFSSPSLTDLNDGGSFGLMSLTRVVVNAVDDGFSLAFRLPFQQTQVFQLASLAASEVAVRLRQVVKYLRPDWYQQPYNLQLPNDPGENDLPEIPTLEEEQDDVFDRTLISYCMAYNINPSIIRYSVNSEVEDSPRFELLESASTVSRTYSNLELLAVLRALRHNPVFSSMSFARISLDGLANSYDRHGTEHLCTQQRRGSPFAIPLEEQKRASVLIQEIRALAITNPNLRRLDFSFCISIKHPDTLTDPDAVPTGCGVVEALYPLCKKQYTRVDWIALNGIALDETDLDYLAGIAADRSCHLRAIEASRCGLTDRGVTLLLDAFRSQTILEAIDLSSNTLRLVPSTLSRQLGAFSHIRKLDLSNLAVEASSEPLLPLDILSTWRLEDLRLKGINLNAATVAALCKYLAHPQSEVLYEVMLSNCSLNGRDAANLMESMTQEPGIARFLHLDIGENRLHLYHESLVGAIARNLAPTHLSMRTIEYERDEQFRELLLALATNQSIRYLDLSKLSLPHEAGEESCQALERFLGENNTLTELDISGEESRLEVSHFGVGINQALNGLKHNETLMVLRIQHQNLGLQGASTLAEVLKSNQILTELHCDHNAISLSGFTDLVSSLATNKTILYMARLEEGRDAALRQTQEQIKLARTRMDGTIQNSPRVSSMRRTFGSLGGSGDNKTSPKVAALPQWTEQDVQAALRLVREGWEGQVQRLNHYLERNWNIHLGVLPPDVELEEPKDIRPNAGNNLAAIFEKVALETTPTIEKQKQLGHGDGHDEPSRKISKDPMLLPDLDFDRDASSFHNNIFGIDPGEEVSPTASSAQFGSVPAGAGYQHTQSQVSSTEEEEEEEEDGQNRGHKSRAGIETSARLKAMTVEGEKRREAGQPQQQDLEVAMPAVRRADSGSTVGSGEGGGRLSIPLSEYQARLLSYSPTKGVSNR